MTNKQLEAMNVKIAKKLGWKNFRLVETPFNTKRMAGVAPGNIRRQFVPQYTNNLSYALQLVDWANEHKYEFKLTKDSNDQPYEVSFFNYRVLSFGHGTRPAMAICEAFLNIK